MADNSDEATPAGLLEQIRKLLQRVDALERNVSDLQREVRLQGTSIGELKGWVDDPFGPEGTVLNTKEPANSGGGNKAEVPHRATVTALQIVKDPDGQRSINIWYRGLK